MCARVDLKYRSVNDANYKADFASTGATQAQCSADHCRTLYYAGHSHYLNLPPYKVLAWAAYWQSIADAKQLGGAA